MGKRFLKGVALGGLLGALVVWMNTTAKGKMAKGKLNAELNKLWKKIEKEYSEANPEGLKDLPAAAKSALKKWKSTAGSSEVAKALEKFLKEKFG